MKIHLIGICGTAMGALAAMLQEQGHDLTGSDSGVYPPISDFLLGRGIEVLEGYEAEHIDRTGPDLVIVGNVIRADNPEAVRTMELGLPYKSLPQILGQEFIAGRESLVAAGTHGKTTTTALLAWLLETAGADPSFLAGGITNNFNSNYRLGRGPHFVIEGDEYDTAFFDKVPKFVHYRPKWTILTGVEYDHADIYPDLASVEAAFARLVDLIPEEGRLLVFSGSPTALELASRAACPVVSYGFSPSSQVRAEEISLGPGRVSFRLLHRGRDRGLFSSNLPGGHNLANTLAAVGLLLEMGFPARALARGLASFKGVKRRQEVIGRPRGVTVIDDFAHHPTAVRETLAALREFYPGQRMVAVFEPRTNTSRRAFFQEVYPDSFGPAQVVLIREPTRLDGIPPQERFSSGRLAADLRSRGKAAQSFAGTDEILDRLVKEARPGDLVVILSNGGFDGLHRRLLAALEEDGPGSHKEERQPEGT